jgi:hypothetical protein
VRRAVITLSAMARTSCVFIFQTTPCKVAHSNHCRSRYWDQSISPTEFYNHEKVSSEIRHNSHCKKYYRYMKIS